MTATTAPHDKISSAVRHAMLCALVLALAPAIGCGDDDGDSAPDTHDDGDARTDASTADSGTHTPRDGGTQPDSGAAAAGMCSDGCECNHDEVCDYECGADCNVMCLGGQCTASCDEGGCTLDADIGALATYSCAGGDCNVDCDVGSTCALDCAGGGCHVTCDEDSTCTVNCAEDGDPCTVTCENGGRGICMGGNCTAENCDTVCEPDPSYAPEIDPADFSTVIDNPLLPWPIGAVFVSEGDGEVITVTVTDEIKTINGVDTLVVHDEVHSPEGELLEDTLDYYAQDAAGNVWYFGEDTVEYVGGTSTTAGSWLYGTDGAQPGIVMKADPQVGDVYRQEYYPCEAEDMGEVVEVGVAVSSTTGDYTDCITTRDYSPLEPSANELKTYCPGVGVVRVVDLAEGGDVVEELTSITLP
jgi:hypothetical protein